MTDPKQALEMDLSDKTLMIVDDEEVVSKVVKMALERIGITNIITAKDGEEAWDNFQLNQGHIDLIISDWNMPKMSGHDLLQKVREVDETVPFILLTGVGTGEAAIQAAKAGVTSFASKPYSPKKLQELVKGIFTKAAKDEDDDAEIIPVVSLGD